MSAIIEQFSGVETMDRLSAAQRPAERVRGYHVWTNLLFIHWRVDPEQLRPLLPASLDVDVFDGSAWVGLVPFEMSGVRPWWSPSVPGVSNFLETNVRTYVHHRGRNPGVWFFSLDATNRLAVRIARTFWRLNYFDARLAINRHGVPNRVPDAQPATDPEDNLIQCAGTRSTAGQSSIAEYSIACRLGPAAGRFESSSGQRDNYGIAVPGTLEHFLVDRYLLYTLSRRGTLMRGQVHHRPYRIRQVEITSMSQSMMAANGIHVADTADHALFCAGVHVEIFGLRSAEEHSA